MDLISAAYVPLRQMGTTLRPDLQSVWETPEAVQRHVTHLRFSMPAWDAAHPVTAIVPCTLIALSPPGPDLTRLAQETQTPLSCALLQFVEALKTGGDPRPSLCLWQELSLVEQRQMASYLQQEGWPPGPREA